MFDRRIVGLVALSIAFAGACALSALAWFGMLSPPLLLTFCFLIGSGMALFGPSWQASVGEQVPSQDLPAAVALNGISYNLARSFGPAIGGAIVAALGHRSFATNALFYLPLMVVLLLGSARRSRRDCRPSDRARCHFGVRYIMHSPSIRIVLLRTMAMGIVGGSVSALLPIVTRDLLGGDARDFGVMLGAFGFGAVIGALNVSRFASPCWARRGPCGCASC